MKNTEAPAQSSQLENVIIPPGASRVFISSPYTHGDPCVNVKVQHGAFYDLLKLGFFPLMPLNGHYQQMHHPMSYDSWLCYTLQMVQISHYVLRLPGISDGADLEVKFATELGIKTAYSLTELEYIWAIDHADQPTTESVLTIL